MGRIPSDHISCYISPNNNPHEVHTHTHKAIFLSLVLALLGVSCAKEGLVPEIRDADKNPESMIKAFIHEASTGTTGRNVGFSLDSAEWYLEAALNYAYSKPWIQGNDQRVDSILVDIELSNGEVSSSDLYQAYSSIERQICSTEGAVDGTLQLVDVISFSGENSLTWVVQMISATGTDRSWPDGPTKQVWFGGPDNFANCGCGPDAGAITPCAHKRIQSRLNWAVGPITPNVYFTNVVTIDAGSGAVYECTGSAFSEFCSCLTPATVDNRSDYGWWLFGSLQPVGKAKISATTRYDQTLGGDNTWWGIGVKFRYGKKHTGASNL